MLFFYIVKYLIAIYYSGSEFRLEFILGKSVIDERLPSYYDPETETAYFFLARLTEMSRSLDDLINKIVRCIIHESLHHAFKVCLGKASKERIEKEHWAMKVINQY